MTKEELLQKLSEIEWDDFECKAAHDKLPIKQSSVFLWFELLFLPLQKQMTMEQLFYKENEKVKPIFETSMTPLSASNHKDITVAR